MTADTVASNVVHRFYADMWNRFDVGVLDDIAAPNVRFRGSLGDSMVGRKALAEYVLKVQAAFPDFHNEVVDILAGQDVVMARLHYTGTHLGPLGPIPPTGRTISYYGLARFLVTDGVIVDAWVLGDVNALYEQLGASGHRP